MLGLFNHQKPSVGLDISDVSLKLIQISPRAGRFRIHAYSDYSIPRDTIGKERFKNPEVIVKLIRQAAAHPKFGRITTKNVVASIPETRSFVRIIQIPIMSEEEAKEAIPWEAETYIPLPISQVYLDWVILGPAPATDSATEGEPGKKLNVLITAAPKGYVDDLVTLLKIAGLQPRALEVESQATARSLVPSSKETVLIADIDTIRTSFIILENGVLQFTSSVPIAGDTFTESIAKALSLEFKEAEEIKRELGLDGEAYKGALKRAFLPVLNSLVTEIKNTIRFYEEHTDHERKISRVLLSGSSSKLKHLPSFLHEKLSQQQDGEHVLRSMSGLRVELGNPWVNILKKSEMPPLSREDSLSFATAIGLAMRGAEE